MLMRPGIRYAQSPAGRRGKPSALRRILTYDSSRWKRVRWSLHYPDFRYNDTTINRTRTSKTVVLNFAIKFLMINTYLCIRCAKKVTAYTRKKLRHPLVMPHRRCNYKTSAVKTLGRLKSHYTSYVSSLRTLTVTCMPPFLCDYFRFSRSFHPSSISTFSS